MQPEENEWLVLPQSIQPPTINPQLEKLNAVARSTECLQHFVLSIEYWISPSGRLRHWLKVNICGAAVLLIPATVLVPAVSLVLHEVDGWLSMLLSIAWKLLVLSTLVSSVVLLIKQFPSSSKGLSRRRK